MFFQVEMASKKKHFGQVVLQPLQYFMLKNDGNWSNLFSSSQVFQLLTRFGQQIYFVYDKQNRKTYSKMQIT